MEENDDCFSLRSAPTCLSVARREGAFIRKAKGMHSFSKLIFRPRNSEKNAPRTAILEEP